MFMLQEGKHGVHRDGGGFLWHVFQIDRDSNARLNVGIEIAKVKRQR